MERVIRKKLVNYLETNQLINSNQHGFRSNHSCATQLQSHTNNILSHLINGDETDSIYIDYAKAFDKVDHNILLTKLEHYGINGKYLDWIKSFLTGREQVVFVNGHFSYPTSVNSGVPQGSVLGPLLFILYINDLPNNIHNSTIFTFADDTKIVKQISGTNDKLDLQNDLNSVIIWSSINNMDLNNKKFQLLNHKHAAPNSSIQLLSQLPFYNTFFNYKVSEDITISPSSSVKDLGIFITSDLSWNMQINKVIKKSKQISAWILNIFYTRDIVTMITLFNSLVRPHTEYCCEIWAPHTIKNIVAIEQIQRGFTNKIFSVKHLNYWDRLVELKMLSLQRRRERIIIITAWKIKNNITPNTINLQFKLHRRTESIKAVLQPMPRVTGRLLTMHEESFTIKAAKLWNTLPAKLTHIKDLNSFKNGLDKYISNIPDQPPIPGYPYQTNNSLLNSSQMQNLTVTPP